MAEGQSPFNQPNSLHVAEDILRKAVRTADDPFLAITKSYRSKGNQAQTSIRSYQLEDEEEK